MHQVGEILSDDATLILKHSFDLPSRPSWERVNRIAVHEGLRAPFVLRISRGVTESLVLSDPHGERAATVCEYRSDWRPGSPGELERAQANLLAWKAASTAEPPQAVAGVAEDLPHLDATDERILKVLYQARKRLRTREIAKLLNRSEKSLAKNLSRLHNDLGYLDNTQVARSSPDSPAGYRLTPKGEARARQI